VLWGINAFDQWGVELGKKLCDEVLPLVRDPDAATGARAMLKPLLQHLRKNRS
jgi:glucose-6-phosphate isomerase